MKKAVLDALSQGIATEIVLDFRSACETIMYYQPNLLDRANFLKLSLPIFAQAVQRNPNRFPTMNEYATKISSFVDGATMSFVVQNPIDEAAGEDAEAAWFERLVVMFEERYPV